MTVNPARFAIIAVLAVIAAVGLLLLFLDRVGIDPVAGPEAVQEGRAEGSDSSSPEEPTPARGNAREELGPVSSGKVNAEQGEFVLDVRDEDDRPLEGVICEWTSLADRVFQAAQRLDFASVEADRVAARSDTNGRVRLASPPFSLQEESVLWLWTPETLPRSLLVSEDAAPWGSTVNLLGAAPLKATVHGARGEEPPQVTQFTIPDPRVTDPVEARARAVLYSRADCEGGVAALLRLPGRSSARAEQGILVSPAWSGVLSEDIALHLYPSLIVEGAVELDPDVDVGALGVTATYWEAHFPQLVTRLAVDATGSIARTRLPHLGDGEYEFRLDGGRSVPDFARLRASAGEDVHWISLRARLGQTLWAYVGEKASDQPIGDAAVSLRHQDFSFREFTLTNPVFAEGDWKGFVRFEGLPDGQVILEAEAPGFAPASSGPHTIPGDLDASWDLLLEPEAFLEGRVTYAGQPVEDFEVCFWTGHEQAKASRRYFRSRANGKFAISVRPGDVHVLATSASQPRSESVKVTVEPGATQQLELELSRAHELRGRVIDIVSGESIEGAEVQLWSSHLSVLVAPWGAPIDTTPDGTFAIHGLIPGRNTVFVRADGYCGAYLDALLVEESLDVGLIALRPTQPLEVQLTGLEGGEYSGFTMDIEGGQLVSDVTFDSHGLARVQEAPGGSIYLDILHPNAGGSTSLRTHLEPGTDWRLEVPVGGRASLTVQAVFPDGQEPSPLSAYLAVPWQDGDYHGISRGLNEEGAVTIGGLPAGPAYVGLYAERGHPRGTALLHLKEGDNAVSVTVSDFVTNVQVVDARGRPVSGAGVQIDHPFLSGVQFSGTTDAEGLCRFQGYSDGDYFLQVIHPTLGCRADVPLRIEADDDTVQVVTLDPQVGLEIRLTDSQGPVAAARCELKSAAASQGLLWRTSDVDGRARWERMTAGSYRLKVIHPRVWLHDAIIQATSVEHPIDVRVRGLGDIALAVAGTGASEHLTLVHQELEGGVDNWLAEGRVRSSTGSLRTDEDGNLLLQGLPEGLYSWSIGPDAHGSVRVSAGVLATERLLVPE